MKPIVIEVEKGGKVILEPDKYREQLDEAYNQGYEDARRRPPFAQRTPRNARVEVVEASE